jgi:hypothetical protein
VLSASFNMLSRYDGLRHARLNALGAYALGLSGGYRLSGDPAAATATTPLRVLPNLEVVAVASLPVADAIVLETYAERVGDAVWRLRRDKYLASIASGRPDGAIVRFLAARGQSDLPATVAAFLQDAAANVGRCCCIAASQRMVKPRRDSELRSPRPAPRPRPPTAGPPAPRPPARNAHDERSGRRHGRQ